MAARFALAEVKDAINLEPAFLPVEMVMASPSDVAMATMPSVSRGRIEIDLTGAPIISDEDGFDPDLLTRLVKGIMT